MAANLANNSMKY